MNIVKKVAVAIIMVAALAASTLLGAKYSDQINTKVDSAKNKVSNIFHKSEKESQKADKESQDSKDASALN